MIEVLKSPRFLLSLMVISAFFGAAVVKGATLAATRTWVGCVLATVVGFVIYRSSRIAPGSTRWRRIQDGVLHPWTAFGPALKAWIFGRAVSMTLVSCLGLTGVVFFIRPDFALPALTGMLLGSGLAAITPHMHILPGSGLKPVRLRLNLRLSGWMPLAMRTSLAGTFRRKVGPVPVWFLNIGIWALATPASALATHNNPDSHIGFAMITGIGLICGLILAWPTMSLVRFLAYHPIPMGRIVRTLCGPQVGLVTLLAIMAAFGAGQPFGLALTSAAVVVAGVCLWLTLLMPYAMTRSVGAAPIMAFYDLVVAAIIKFALQFGVMALVWLVVRAGSNIRSVGHNRWREPT